MILLLVDGAHDHEQRRKKKQDIQKGSESSGLSKRGLNGHSNSGRIQSIENQFDYHQLGFHHDPDLMFVPPAINSCWKEREKRKEKQNRIS